MTDRAAGADRFLAGAGWGAATRHHLAGDASDRRYLRLHLADRTAVLMDSPPGGADNVLAFVTMARHLRGLGLSAPKVLAKDLADGFLLLEDLGDGLLARLLATNPDREAALYAPAVDVLHHLQSVPVPLDLPDLSPADWAQAAGLAVDCYAFAATFCRPDPEPLLAALAAALAAHADGPRVLILRDFHAENLLWLPERTGLARVGLLDFQLGQMGQSGYDLVSLLQDARRDVTTATESAMIARFVAATGADARTFAAQYAVLGTQRALRILGVFARLCLTAGKPGYLRLIARVWGQLQRNLLHRALTDVRAECARLLPEPTPEILKRIESQCATSSFR